MGSTGVSLTEIAPSTPPRLLASLSHTAGRFARGGRLIVLQRAGPTLGRLDTAAGFPAMRGGRGAGRVMGKGLNPSTAALARRAAPAAPLASTTGLLVQGGDGRLALDRSDGLNLLRLSARADRARPLDFASSTASIISRPAFAAAEPDARARLCPRRWPASRRREVYARELDALRDELLTLNGLADLPGVEIAFAASGTDLHLMVAELVGGEPDAPLLCLSVEAVETGSGVPQALGGRHFSDRAALGQTPCRPVRRWARPPAKCRHPRRGPWAGQRDGPRGDDRGRIGRARAGRLARRPPGVANRGRCLEDRLDRAGPGRGDGAAPSLPAHAGGAGRRLPVPALAGQFAGLSGGRTDGGGDGIEVPDRSDLLGRPVHTHRSRWPIGWARGCSTPGSGSIRPATRMAEGLAGGRRPRAAPRGQLIGLLLALARGDGRAGGHSAPCPGAQVAAFLAAFADRGRGSAAGGRSDAGAAAQPPARPGAPSPPSAAGT